MSTMRKAALRSVVTPALVVLIFAGCSSDQLTAVPSSGAAFEMGEQAEVGKPFKADCELRATTTEFTQSGFVQTVTGVCQASHKGRSSFYGIDVVDFGTGAYEMHAVITAANGDEMHATITGKGTLTATGAILAGLATITGGTGRFANASGQSAQSAVVTATGPATATASYHLDGRLAY